MIRYLLDTGAAGDYVDGRHGVRERASDAVSRGHRVGVALPVLAELWYGIEFSSSREKNADRLRRALPTMFVWPLTGVYSSRAKAEEARLGEAPGFCECQDAFCIDAYELDKDQWVEGYATVAR